jgi:hypothetical protein
LAWAYHNWPEEHVVDRFFDALQQKDYEDAYGIWMHDPAWKQHAQKYAKYSYGDFYNDWGPGGEWGTGQLSQNLRLRNSPRRQQRSDRGSGGQRPLRACPDLGGKVGQNAELLAGVISILLKISAQRVASVESSVAIRKSAGLGHERIRRFGGANEFAGFES